MLKSSIFEKKSAVEKDCKEKENSTNPGICKKKIMEISRGSNKTKERRGTENNQIVGTKSD